LSEHISNCWGIEGIESKTDLATWIESMELSEGVTLVSVVQAVKQPTLLKAF
jgi:hypothetical protein